MQVIYDISPVGSNPNQRTGLARVAWATARLLQQKLGSNVSFSACGSIWATIQAEELLCNHTDFASATYPISSLSKRLHQSITHISESEKKAQPLQKAVLRATNLALNSLSRSLNVTRKPIERAHLAKADIFHSSYARIPRQVRRTLPKRHILTVHDLTPLILPEHFFVPGQLGITRRIISSIKPDDWVIAVSESTRNDLCDRCPIDPDRVVVIPNAASREFFYPEQDTQTICRIRQKYKIPDGQYLLSLHSLAPHKNLEHLIRCFKLLLAQEKIHDLMLVISGGQKHSIEQVIKALKLTDKDLETIHFVGFVPDEDLAALYSGAISFVFPSLYEGFGLPVLEAMQCGCPVIASNTSSLPEVVGEAGFLITVNDEDMLCESILKLYHSYDLCSKLSTLSINRAGLFSWGKTVEATLDLYKKIS